MANTAQNTVGGDLYVSGALSCGSLTPPANSVTDAAVATGASGSKVSATKLQHQHLKLYAQASGTTASTESRVIHYVYGAVGTLVSLKAGNVVAPIGAATVTVNLKKNGSSILTGGTAITLDNTTTAYTGIVSGTFSSAALAAGDVLEFVFTATAGGGTLPTGVWAEVILREDPV